MQIITRSFVAFSALALLSATRLVQAQSTYTYLTNSVAINSPITTDYAIVGFSSGTMQSGFQNAYSPTVNLLSGSDVSSFLALYNRSTVNVNGGNVSGTILVYNNTTTNIINGNVKSVFAYDLGTVNILGGLINSTVLSVNRSTINVNGGSINGAVYIKGNSIINLSGGDVAFGLVAYEASTVNVFGTNLTTSLVDANASGGFSRYSLSGTLLDGTVYTNKPFFIQNGTAASFRINPGTRISGTVTLQNAVNTGQLVTFRLIPVDGSDWVIRAVPLNADGTFELAGIPPKSYTVLVNGVKWLTRRIALDTTNGDISSVNMTLLGGDANNDNAVDINDLVLLINAYNQIAPATDYLEAVDFNNDGSNDILDLLILIENYNQIGD